MLNLLHNQFCLERGNPKIIGYYHFYIHYFPFLCLRVTIQLQGLRGFVSWSCPQGTIEAMLLIRNRFISKYSNCAKMAFIEV